MSTAELNRKKLDLISWINSLSDESMIDILESLKSSNTKNDWWNSLSKSQQNSIEEGLDDQKNGRVVSSSKFWRSLKSVD